MPIIEKQKARWFTVDLNTKNTVVASLASLRDKFELAAAQSGKAADHEMDLTARALWREKAVKHKETANAFQALCELVQDFEQGRFTEVGVPLPGIADDAKVPPPDFPSSGVSGEEKS